MACIPCLNQPSSSNSDIEALTNNVDFPNRVPELESIEDSRPHRLTLEDWKAELNASNKNLVRKLSSRNSSSSDLYQILGLFFVFEGVVITALAQASALKCHNWYLVVLLSAIAFFATLCASIHKLKEIVEAGKLYLEEKAICSSLSSSIAELKERGRDFDLRMHQPTLRTTYTDREDQSRGSLTSCKELLIDFIKTWVWSYSGAVIFILIVFSGVTLAAIRLIVCDPHRN